MYGVTSKDHDFSDTNKVKDKIIKLDLHGYTLIEANNIVEKFILDCFEANHRKLLIITGKGLRTKTKKNPYVLPKASDADATKSDKESYSS